MSTKTGADAVEGEGSRAPSLSAPIRQISLASDRVVAIQQELATLRQTENALLREQDQQQEREGGDLLAELATAVREQIARARDEYEALANQEGNPA